MEIEKEKCIDGVGEDECWWINSNVSFYKMTIFSKLLFKFGMSLQPSLFLLVSSCSFFSNVNESHLQADVIDFFPAPQLLVDVSKFQEHDDDDSILSKTFTFFSSSSW